MKTRPNYWKTIEILKKLGIQFFANGVLRKDKVKYGDYYRVYQLDPALRQELKKEFGDWLEIKPDKDAVLIIILSLYQIKEKGLR